MKTNNYLWMIVLMFCCLAAIYIPNRNVSAAQPFFKPDERGVSLQYVPLGNGCNGWSDSQKIYGGERKNVKWVIYKPDDLSGDTVFINHFIGIQKVNADAADSVTVIVENARIITDDETVIPFQSLDGKYEITECESGTQLCTDNTVSFKAEDIDRGYFCATISVQYNSELEEDNLMQLAQITGNLPGDEFYQVSGNQIELTDFSFDGTMCITGSDAQDTVELVIKGDCSISHLVIQCPVIVKRYAYGSLTCNEYECSNAGSVTFDSKCNATRIVKNGGKVSIEFDDTKVDMTQGEIDEKNDTYNFPWRHRNSEWYQTALAMIENNRMQTPQLHFVDENGNAVEADQVELKLSDYDYLFGHGNHGVMLNDNGQLIYWENSTEQLKGNVIIEYDAFGWESFDPSHQGEYNFDTSNSGNTTYIKDGTVLLEENGITRFAQPIIYPSFGSMRFNSASTTMFDSVVGYIFSDSYTPEGFNQVIKEHITEEVKEYAGVVKVWAVVNEAYYSTDFFKLIYGTDGTGISKETIASVLEENGVSDGTNKEKLDVLVSYLKKMDITPANETAKLIAEWAETAQAAWDSTITPDCGYTSDTLTLYYNDAVFKGYTADGEDHYSYNLELIQALGNPETYPGRKVLIPVFGSQFASWYSYRTSPQEVWEMLDDAEAAGEKTWVTEFCYWVDHPYSENGDDISWYGNDNPGYITSGFLSKAEEEFAYDYAYYILTALYAHENSKGFHSTCYPHGQIGLAYRNQKVSPLGEAYDDLVMDEWNSSFTADLNGKTAVTTEPLSYGTYAVNITVGDKVYQQNIEIGAENKDITITLEDAAGCITYALEEDSYSVSVQKGAYVFLPECPVKNIGNSSFVGWSEKKDGSGTIYKAGSKYVKQFYGEVILYPIYQETECMTAVLYSDEQYSNVSEELGTFKNTTALNEALEGKNGYLQIVLERDTVLDALPGTSSISKVKICNKEQKDFVLSIEAANLSLQSDVVFAVNTQLLSEDVNLQGEHKIILENMMLSGKKLTAEEVEFICGEWAILDVDINGAKALYVNQNKTLTEEDGNWSWENVYGSSFLRIKGKLSGIGTLYMYGSSIFLENSGSMEIDSIAGIYGDIYLQKTENGKTGFTVNKTMADMIWQIRMKVYETLNQEAWHNTELCTSIPTGTPLANLPKSADESCISKLGFIIGDDWGTYDNKLYQDEILYYDDGTSVIEHLWGSQGVCETCGIHKGVIENKDYPTEIVFGKELASPTAENFKINSGATPTFTWYKGDLTKAEELPAEGDDVLGSTVPFEIGTYTLVVVAEAVDGETDYTAAELRVKVVIAEGKMDPTYTVPTGLTAKCGDMLSTVSLEGTGFEWMDEDVALEAGLSENGGKVTKKAKYVPEDTNNYNVVENIDLDIIVTHVKVTDPPVAATCEKDGKTAGSHCSKCDKIIEKQVAVKAKGHTWDAGKVTKEATETAEGVMTYTCKICGKTKAGMIPKKSAIPEIGDIVKDNKSNASYKVADTVKKEVTYTAPADKNAKTITIPKTVTVKGSVYKVTAIEDKAFFGCRKLDTVTISSNVTTIGKNAFYGCKKLTKVIIGKNVKTIGASAFSGCSKLKTVSMGANVTTIGDKAFYKCTTLNKVTIPAKVTKIGKQAFYGCKTLKTITIKTTKLTSSKVGSQAFKGIYSKAKIKVPKSKVKAYKNLLKAKGCGSKVTISK